MISDGYSAYQQLLPQLAGVQQCCQHVIRRARAVTKLGPGSLQSWAADVIDVLREAHQAVEEARARGDPALDAELLAKLRERYDQAVAFGITHNRHRDWHDGNHPGYALGCWLRDYKEQVWLFTTQFAVDWTNNCSEQAVKAAKRHQAVSGYWHTPRTLARWCRIRSYLDSAASHGLTALDATTRALAGEPWLPAPAAAGNRSSPPTPEWTLPGGGRGGAAIAQAGEIAGVVEQAVGEMIGGAQLPQSADRGGQGRGGGRIAIAGGQAGADQGAFGLQHGREVPVGVRVQHGEQLAGGVFAAQVVSGAAGERPPPPHLVMADPEGPAEGARVSEGGAGMAQRVPRLAAGRGGGTAARVGDGHGPPYARRLLRGPDRAGD